MGYPKVNSSSDLKASSNLFSKSYKKTICVCATLSDAPGGAVEAVPNFFQGLLEVSYEHFQ
jgi:hypothetical protein